MALTDAERVFVEALRTVRAKMMDTITGLDDTIAEVEQAAAARIDPAPRDNPQGIIVREHPPELSCPVCRAPAALGGDGTLICSADWDHVPPARIRPLRVY